MENLVRKLGLAGKAGKSVSLGPAEAGPKVVVGSLSGILAPTSRYFAFAKSLKCSWDPEENEHTE